MHFCFSGVEKLSYHCLHDYTWSNFAAFSNPQALLVNRIYDYRGSAAAVKFTLLPEAMAVNNSQKTMTAK